MGRGLGASRLVIAFVVSRALSPAAVVLLISVKDDRFAEEAEKKEESLPSTRTPQLKKRATVPEDEETKKKTEILRETKIRFFEG